MKRARKDIIASNEISEIIKVKLGGYDQKIMIEGRSKNLPIVIVLHGGPGTPVPFCAGARGLFPEFTDKCVLVCWDQYGCGINNARLPDDWSVDDLVGMTSDLIITLKNRFPDNRIYLFGMSWGTVLSAKVSVLQKEILDGVIAYGQVLYDLMRSEDTIRAVLDSRAPRKVKEYVKDLEKRPFTAYETGMKMSSYIRKYTNGYVDSNELKVPVFGMVRGILFSPDYSFRDFLAIVNNGYMKNHSLIEELSRIDLREELSKVEIPYHIIQGASDIVTSTGLIEKFVNGAGNKNLTCTVVKNAAHFPGMNAMNAVMDHLISFIQETPDKIKI